MFTQQMILYLLITIGVLLFIIGILFVYLIRKRSVYIKKLLLINEYIDNYEKDWFDYLIYSEPLKLEDIPAELKKVEMIAIDRIFLKYKSVIKNEEVKKRISNYANEKMTQYYFKRFTSDNWAKRVNVLKKVTMFDLHFLIPTIETKLIEQRFKSREETLLALDALAAHDLTKFNEMIQRGIFKLNEYEYKVLLSKLSMEQLNAMVSLYNDLPLSFQLAYLDTISANSSLQEKTIYFLESQLVSGETEIRVRALKAIRSFGAITSLSNYHHFLNSEVWEERLMLASILKFTDDEASYQMLEKLIKDSNWKVRKEAALSLTQKKAGSQLLLNMARQSEDRYAAEISREVLELR